jgi:SAM-dependent methyltransferase
MSSYRGFASIYDLFMADGPYDDWKGWLDQHFDMTDWVVADVGCGTGKLTNQLASRCHSMTGIDVSEEMLALAAADGFGQRHQVRWLCQDMRDFRLPAPADLILSTCDSLNYVLTRADLQRTFVRIYDNLQDSGWFCFDVFGPKRLDALRDGFWYDLQDEADVIYETSVDADTGRIAYEVHGYVHKSANLYEKFVEHHAQQFYSVSQIHSLLVEVGFREITISGDFGRSPAETSDRIVVSAQK